VSGGLEPLLVVAAWTLRFPDISRQSAVQTPGRPDPRIRLHSTGLKGGKAILGLLGPQLVDPRVRLVETCKQG